MTYANVVMVSRSMAYVHKMDSISDESNMTVVIKPVF